MRNILITNLLDNLWNQGRPFSRKNYFKCITYHCITIWRNYFLVKSIEPRLTKDIKTTLLELANLSRGENSTVSLKARTILIASEKPSYELRFNKIEKLFLDAIGANTIGKNWMIFLDENYINFREINFTKISVISRKKKPV